MTSSGNVNVLKVGGGAGVDHAAVMENLARRIKSGEKWVLVHGCSDATNKLTKEVGYEPKTITSPGGHTSRYTDARTIELFSMAAAAVNQELVSLLFSHAVQAVGLAGPNLIHAERKKAIRAIQNGRQIVIRDDYSGKIKGIYAGVLLTLLDGGFMPVVAPLAIGEEYERLNVDGDLVAATIARALNANTFIIFSNVPGLLKDVEKPDSLITGFRLGEVEKYEHYAAGRMKKKLLAAQDAQAGVTILADSRVASPLDSALAGSGTHIVK